MELRHFWILLMGGISTTKDAQGSRAIAGDVMLSAAEEPHSLKLLVMTVNFSAL